MEATKVEREQFLQDSLMDLCGPAVMMDILPTLLCYDCNSEADVVQMKELLTGLSGQPNVVDTVIKRYVSKFGDSVSSNTHLAKPDLIPDSVKVTMKVETGKSCGCHASKHACMGNCTCCGRIHCSAEIAKTQDSEMSKFPCLSCRNPVLSPRNAETVERSGCQSAEELSAYQRKDRLLGFDKEHKKRTRIFDAQGDYYESEIWLSEEEKASLREKEEKRRERLVASRGPSAHRMRIGVDLAGRRVIQIDASTERNQDDMSDTSDADDDALDAVDGDGDNLAPTGGFHGHGETIPSQPVPEKVDGSSIAMAPSLSLNTNLAYRRSKTGQIYRTLRQSVAQKYST
jgi:hypothetical protein